MSFGTAKLPPLGAPPGRSPFRSPKGLATALTVLLGLCAATRLFTGAAGINRYLVLDALVEGGAADAVPSWQLYSRGLSFAVTAMVVTAVVFVVWFHRVRVNAGGYAPGMFGGFVGGTGWAVGVWFIPLVGWTVLAYMIAVKVWAAGASRLSGSSARPVSAAPVAAWAGSFGAAMLVAVAANRLAAGAVTDAEFRDSVLVGVASDVLYVVAAGCAIVFVRRLSAMQSRA
ncbi:DUF4328 domain-containing protein [Streptomyces sp. NPDC059874]|uniref:DUF4328 domain-containing protein n=1 Tax=Streptomyces sp. NPDC059874 TaxID=3346983 RepID=UPI003662614D